jgi:hypothetical protein
LDLKIDLRDIPSMVASNCLRWSSHSISVMQAFLETSPSSRRDSSRSALKRGRHAPRRAPGSSCSTPRSRPAGPGSWSAQGTGSIE